MIKVNMPKWGMGIDEGTVVRWLKSEGDPVAAGEPLVEVETAKTTQEIEAPASGILVRISAPEGEEIKVNAELGLIDDA
jgi:pyruvate/2-oxoglutarate dehydrogenase complex dihydrolipoamide acyltransferase (E2) component